MKVKKLNISEVADKCHSKTIATHLVLPAIMKQDQQYVELLKKHKDLQHYSNKHQQLMKSEIKRLKEINAKLRNEVAASERSGKR